jgi:predicted glycoside hydrolase/deacetylase ChbG (UPF0249 family)
MPRLILNADDFGMSAGISKGIALCGQVCEQISTSVMTCVPGARDLAAKHLAGFRGCIGLHLQLSEGSPVLRRTDIPSLSGPSGEFLPNEEERNFADEVLSEWRGQAARIASWGIAPTHIDSHQNWHSLPQLWPAYARIALEFGLLARGGAADLVRFLRARAVATPDVSVRFWRLEPRLDVLCNELDRLRDSARGEITVEVISHPGLIEGVDLVRIAGAERRNREFEIFSSETTYKRLRD